MTQRTIIGLCGRKRSGKGLAAATIHAVDPSYLILAIADALKIECAEALGIDTDDIYSDKEFYRPFLQWYGTEFRRRNNDNYWVDELEKSVRNLPLGANAVIEDVRFQNEIDWIHRMGGSVIYVDKEHIADENSNHSSEQVEHLADMCDEVVHNDGEPGFLIRVAAAFRRLSTVSCGEQQPSS